MQCCGPSWAVSKNKNKPDGGKARARADMVKLIQLSNQSLRIGQPSFKIISGLYFYDHFKAVQHFHFIYSLSVDKT